MKINVKIVIPIFWEGKKVGTCDFVGPVWDAKLVKSFVRRSWYHGLKEGGFRAGSRWHTTHAVTHGGYWNCSGPAWSHDHVDSAVVHRMEASFWVWEDVDPNAYHLIDFLEVEVAAKQHESCEDEYYQFEWKNW